MSTGEAIGRLQNVLRDTDTFRLDDYFTIGETFLDYVQTIKPTRIVLPSPKNNHYIFYQYGSEYSNKITRPLNTNLFIESPKTFKDAFERFTDFLSDLKRYQEKVNSLSNTRTYLESNEINKVIYTVQLC
jgi:hypothetical protein